MSDGEPEHCETTLSRRKPPLLLFSAAAGLVLIAWLIAQYPAIPKAQSLDDVSPTYNLMAAGALPWFLQWAGVTCAILGCGGSRNTRSAELFAIVGSFTLAAIWWSGLAFKFRGMDPLEVIADATMFEIKSQSGSSTAFDEILFHFIGPMLGPFQLRGPLSLHGWNLFLAMLSTTVMVGYLLIVGRLCRIGSRSRSASDYVKFIFAILPCFIPPFIRLGIRIAQTA